MTTTQTISRERLEEIIGVINAGAYGYSISAEEIGSMARTLLAAMDSEPVAWMQVTDGEVEYNGHNEFSGGGRGIPLYAAPPAQIDDIASWSNGKYPPCNEPAPVAVPDERAAFNTWNNDTDCPLAGLYAKAAAWKAWSRRSVMQAEPVTAPDDVRRMDWLVSKTVNVREPLVYGSRDLFWSQTISDDWEEEHKTTLRAQIDAAMSAEKPAAPEQEV